ncbi:MAG: hypothetical protein UZ13_02013 [Chloroflexi bacterium OLB13]|nr:MAG: hypothetical protein UZ13_02013 [Chloroflexi bacterium OLB13]
MKVYVLEHMHDAFDRVLLGVFDTLDGAIEAASRTHGYADVQDEWLKYNENMLNFGGAWGWYISELELNALAEGE